MANEDKVDELNRAFAALAADSVRGLSDEDLGRQLQGTVALLEAIKAEYERRNAIKEGKSDTGRKPIGRA